MIQIPRPATALTLAALLATSLASAHPGPADLDRRRDRMLDEMHERLERWKARPTTPPTVPDDRQRPPEVEVFDDGPDVIDDGMIDDSNVIENGMNDNSDIIEDGIKAGTPDDSHNIESGSHAITDDSYAIDDAPYPAAPAPVDDTPPPAVTARPEPPAAPTPTPTVAPPAADAAPSPDARPSLDAPLPLGRHDAALIARAVLDATNSARARHGLPPLAAHPTLDAAAVEYAEHLARVGHFGHIDPSRPAMKTPGDRVRAAGGADVLAAENLITETWLQVDGGEQMFVVDAARHRYSRVPDGPLIPPHSARSLAASMVSRWLDSPGHRRNILDTEGREMGFGMAWDPQSDVPSLVAVQLFQRYHPLGGR